MGDDARPRTMKIYTIGFTRKPAAEFFGSLQKHGVERVIDIRLNPRGQLSGYAKQKDLPYFLARLARCDYQHMEILAPTRDMLARYRRDFDWLAYAAQFEALMDEREVPDVLDRRLFEEITCCLLCSEATPQKCHRRLVAERLAGAWPDVAISHLI